MDRGKSLSLTMPKAKKTVILRERASCPEKKGTNNKMMSAKRANGKNDSARSSKGAIYVKEFHVVNSTSSSERELKELKFNPSCVCLNHRHENYHVIRI